MYFEVDFTFYEAMNQSHTVLKSKPNFDFKCLFYVHVNSK